jgi:streptomycin 6-kinase
MEDPGGLPMPSGLTSDPECRGKDRADWEAWLGRLPGVVSDAAAHWHLRIGAPFQPGGHTAWVAPARTAAEHPVVVKVTWPHFEAENEADGLRLWGGQGAVKLLDTITHSGTRVLLLEACTPGTPLTAHPEAEQDVVIAGLLRRLWVSPPVGHPLRPLETMCRAWADEFEERETRRRPEPADSGLLRHGMELLRLLPTDTETDAVLCTDLHAGNVLSSTRERWLMIDPKPHIGDPAYDLIQHLLNCRERLHANPRGLAERVAGLCGVESDRVGRWLFARCVQESHQWPDLLDVARAVDPG